MTTPPLLPGEPRYRPPIVGLDPGARYVGIAGIRHPWQAADGAPFDGAGPRSQGRRRQAPAPELVYARVLDRDRVLDGKLAPTERRYLDPTTLGPWVDAVLDELDRALEETGESHPPIGEPSAVVAVEGLNRPSPRIGMTDAATTIATGVVLGAVLGRHPGALLIPPAGHGNALDLTYPPAIRSGTRGLGGPSKHARSAHDVAQAARMRPELLYRPPR